MYAPTSFKWVEKACCTSPFACLRNDLISVRLLVEEDRPALDCAWAEEGKTREERWNGEREQERESESESERKGG